MTRFKKLAVIGTAVLAIGATSLTAFAASYFSTPAQAAAGVTGKTTEEVIAERNETGKTYGTIANDAGKLQEFKDEMLKTKKAILDERVKEGLVTQEQADEIYAAIEANQANCTGTGNGGMGKQFGAGFGKMMGQGQGRGMGQGQGRIMGGCGFGNGACLNSEIQ